MSDLAGILEEGGDRRFLTGERMPAPRLLGDTRRGDRFPFSGESPALAPVPVPVPAKLVDTVPTNTGAAATSEAPTL